MVNFFGKNVITLFPGELGLNGLRSSFLPMLAPAEPALLPMSLSDAYGLLSK